MALMPTPYWSVRTAPDTVGAPRTGCRVESGSGAPGDLDVSGDVDRAVRDVHGDAGAAPDQEPGPRRASAPACRRPGTTTVAAFAAPLRVDGVEQVGHGLGEDLRLGRPPWDLPPAGRAALHQRRTQGVRGRRPGPIAAGSPGSGENAEPGCAARPGRRVISPRRTTGQTLLISDRRPSSLTAVDRDRVAADVRPEPARPVGGEQRGHVDGGDGGSASSRPRVSHARRPARQPVPPRRRSSVASSTAPCVGGGCHPPPRPVDSRRPAAASPRRRARRSHRA